MQVFFEPKSPVSRLEKEILFILVRQEDLDGEKLEFWEQLDLI